jgi:hypothetical protein
VSVTESILFLNALTQAEECTTDLNSTNAQIAAAAGAPNPQ